MFRNTNYLKMGNEKQKRAFAAIESLGIMKQLSEYNPTLCGTLPIEMDIEGSDLDMIMEVYDLKRFEEELNIFYRENENYRIKQLIIREQPVVKANFIFEGFEFELFGQPRPIESQYAYLHMLIEDAVIKEFPEVKAKVISLKQQGFKTEPAFCQVLELEGKDPYESLLTFGRNMGYI
ncbi:DUF4269 domain-containing protein [Robertmurraya massiliosenegalensis]|uniref:DUF4269 domain-containing protein n=1 Tax=Robertmurraya massiliosenegalensis TaxID=1287657 RepID=UPI0003146426|nr:DUF4269 domain-containing protein [Robertmurraya massiliosenegalensis]